MGLTKNIQMQIRQLQQQAEGGEINELDAYIILNDIENDVKQAKEAIKDSAITQCEKYGQKKFKHSGREIELRNKRTWVYKHIPAWQEIDAKRKALEEKAKAAALHELDTSSETGETIEAAQYKDSTFPVIGKPYNGNPGEL